MKLVFVTDNFGSALINKFSFLINLLVGFKYFYIFYIFFMFNNERILYLLLEFRLMSLIALFLFNHK